MANIIFGNCFTLSKDKKNFSNVNICLFVCLSLVADRRHSSIKYLLFIYFSSKLRFHCGLCSSLENLSFFKTNISKIKWVQYFKGFTFFSKFGSLARLANHKTTHVNWGIFHFRRKALQVVQYIPSI